MTIDTLLNPNETPRATAAQVANVLRICGAVADVVREEKTTPAGPVYAALMTKGITLSDFDAIIATLARAGLVERRGTMLNWTGPEIVKAAAR